MVEKITPVPLRDVWVHEALDFTPWLVENLGFLNDALPFELIEAEREKAAGTSWVDVVAKDADGGVVVIENQLGTSDHDHLGKVITYLATYGAKRAIWIVRDARPEHIQALNWLNGLGPVDFFLVGAEAFKVGGSNAAKFTLIAGPSDLLRTAGETKRRQASSVSETLLSAIDECKFLGGLPKKVRRQLARVTEYAVRFLLHRTVVGSDAFAGRRTHADLPDFLTRHPRVLECVNRIREEDSLAGNISRYVFSTGYAAGLLYLMGCSASDGDAYRAADSPSERFLDWRNWEKACNFWALFASGAEETKPVRDAIASLLEQGRGSRPERWAVLVKAWDSYVAGEPITPATVALEYRTDPDGSETLAEQPIAGGIDLGEPSDATD